MAPVKLRCPEAYVADGALRLAKEPRFVTAGGSSQNRTENLTRILTLYRRGTQRFVLQVDRNRWSCFGFRRNTKWHHSTIPAPALPCLQRDRFGHALLTRLRRAGVASAIGPRNRPGLSSPAPQPSPFLPRRPMALARPQLTRGCVASKVRHSTQGDRPHPPLEGRPRLIFAAPQSASGLIPE
jgi:hypothetical protein